MSELKVCKIAFSSTFFNVLTNCVMIIYLNLVFGKNNLINHDLE